MLAQRVAVCWNDFDARCRLERNALLFGWTLKRLLPIQNQQRVGSLFLRTGTTSRRSELNAMSQSVSPVLQDSHILQHSSCMEAAEGRNLPAPSSN